MKWKYFTMMWYTVNDAVHIMIKDKNQFNQQSFGQSSSWQPTPDCPIECRTGSCCTCDIETAMAPNMNMISNTHHMTYGQHDLSLPPPIPAAVRVAQQGRLDHLGEEDDDVIQLGDLQVTTVNYISIANFLPIERRHHVIMHHHTFESCSAVMLYVGLIITYLPWRQPWNAMCSLHCCPVPCAHLMTAQIELQIDRVWW